MKFTKIPTKDLQSFMESRKMQDAINKALSKAKSYGMSEQECQPLIIQKLKIVNEFKQNKNYIISCCIDSNLVDFGNNWYGIVCSNGKQNDLIVHPLVSNTLNQIYVDFVSERIKKKEEYDSFIKANTDFGTLDEYKNEILRLRDKLIFDFFNCADSITKDNKEYKLTSHCMRRWRERIEPHIETMNVENHELVVDGITKSFQRSEFVYLGDDENCKFFLDKEEMIFFVVSMDNIIMSLWRNDFGFTDKKINAVATLMQLENVQKLRNEYEDYKFNKWLEIDYMKSERSYISSDIDEINRQIEELTKQRTSLREKDEEIRNNITSIQNDVNEKHVALLHEESFIFKSHKVVAG